MDEGVQSITYYACRNCSETLFREEDVVFSFGGQKEYHIISLRRLPHLTFSLYKGTIFCPICWYSLSCPLWNLPEQMINEIQRYSSIHFIIMDSSKLMLLRSIEM